MIAQEFWGWLTRAFSNLPRSRDPFFRRLWGEGLLRFNQPGQMPDGLDEWSARLVCAGLERRQRLFIVLPDFQPRRPALLFATGLIMCALDHLRIVEATLRAREEGDTREQEDSTTAQPIPGCRVLYFGSTVGIRQHLEQIEVQGRMRMQLNWRQHGVRNVEELLRHMQKRGSTLMSSLTLRQWLSGETLCPQDEEDLHRLAEVLDLGFVRQYHRRIYQAAHRLRGLHRGLAHRLNHWLEQQAAGLATGSDDDLIDTELGLTFGDFRNSLLILRVAAVQSVAGPFMRSRLGKLGRDSN